jgi:hypothetical protein
MPKYDDYILDLPIEEGKTIDNYMKIIEKDNVPNSEDCDFGSKDISDEEIEKLLGITNENSEERKL